MKLVGIIALVAPLATACIDMEEIDSETQEVHSWGDYHWARTTPSFDLIVVNSLTSDWDGYADRAVADWSVSQNIDMVQDQSGDTSNKTRRRCKGDAGQVRICNLAYGQTGWLGIAGISLDSNGHINSGYTKLNDTYFASGTYNDPTWKQMVTCQELGHNIGLGHTSEDFYDEPDYTCMDYQADPYPYPNAHDYEQLALIYGHVDSYDSYDTGSTGGDGGGDGGGSGCNAPPGKGCNKVTPPEWGESFGRLGRVETFVRPTPTGLEITKVTWAE